MRVECIEAGLPLSLSEESSEDDDRMEEASNDEPAFALVARFTME